MTSRIGPVVLAALSATAATAMGGDEPAPFPAPTHIACSHQRFNIAVYRDGTRNVLTRTDRDFKPVSSPDGQHLAFFRVVTYGDGSFETWKTILCVINTDGTGLRELTSGQYADYNPTWTRDGSNRIVFNRYNRTGRRACEILWTRPDAERGAEELISHPTIPSYEWAYSALKDGRLFIHRIQSAEREVYLLTPSPGGEGKYERVTMPSNQYFHKACIAPSETKITYMYDNDNNGATYEDVQIAWAKLDVANLRVTDQVLITADDRSTVDEYPKWSPDESLVIYDSNKPRSGKRVYQIYAHRIADGAERCLSADPSQSDQFACVIGYPE